MGLEIYGVGREVLRKIHMKYIFGDCLPVYG